MKLAQLESTPRVSYFGARHARWLTLVCLVLTALVLYQLGTGLWYAWKNHVSLQYERQALAQTQQALQLATETTVAAPRTVSRTQPTRRTPALNNALVVADAKQLSTEQRRQLNHVTRQLNTPWYDLFEQLERETQKDVALVSIEPDARKGVIRLQAEAKNLDALLSYAARLQHTGVLGALTLNKHETNDQDPNKPARLSMEFNLQPPARLLEADAAVQPEAQGPSKSSKTSKPTMQVQP